MEVTVVLIENRSFNVDIMNLPRQEGEYEFSLRHEGWIRDRELFTRYEQLLTSLNGPSIVLLDLGIDGVTLSKEEERDLGAFLNCSPRHLPLATPDQYNGLYLGMKALKNDKWYGELVIAVSNLGFRDQENLKSLISAAQQRNRDVKLYTCPGTADKPDQVTDAAIQQFLRDFDPIWWFLKPPGIEDDPNMEWFDVKRNDAHHSGTFYAMHKGAVGKRYESWKDDIDASKALLHSVNFSVTRQGRADRRFPWIYLKDFFGKMHSDNLSDDSMIALPVAPGFPFLVSLQRLFTELGREPNTPVLLHSLGKDVIALGLLNTHPTWETWARFVEHLWKGTTDNGGSACKAYRKALEAKVTHMFSGTPPHLGSVLNGLPNVAVPWITENFIGVSWETITRPIPAE